MTESTELKGWIGVQADASATALERAISAVAPIRQRQAFNQLVRPARGSVLASCVVGDWDPVPDYFFHWVRDSAIVMRTVAELMADAPAPAEGQRWRRHFDDFVRFSLTLTDLDGAAFLNGSQHREATRADHRRFLRPDAEIRALVGDALLGEPRFEADGTIDVQKWSRPQYDGPALRALACLRYLAAGGEATAAIIRLLHIDLGFTLRHADAACIGPWEEPDAHGHHYPVALVQLGALVHGRGWAGDPVHGTAAEWRAAEARLRSGLDRHWTARHGVYAARRDATAESAADLVDAAQLLAVLDADLPEGPHSVRDDRVQATLAEIEDLFAHDLPINRDRPAGRGPALGRYRGDRLFGGGAWYVTTLAAAGIRYRLAQCPGQDAAALIARGDATLATIRDLVPADGTLPEQVDRTTGKPTSCPDLTWSHAAFLGTVRLRAKALDGRA